MVSRYVVLLIVAEMLVEANSGRPPLNGQILSQYHSRARRLIPPRGWPSLLALQGRLFPHGPLMAMGTSTARLARSEGRLTAAQ